MTVAEGKQSDLEHNRGGPNENAEIDKMKREAANPPMPWDTRTDEEREKGKSIPLQEGARTPGAKRKPPDVDDEKEQSKPSEDQPQPQPQPQPTV
jgi:hypothetical protein